jgi:hypothetical protein
MRAQDYARLSKASKSRDIFFAKAFIFALDFLRRKLCLPAIFLNMPDPRLSPCEYAMTNAPPMWE